MVPTWVWWLLIAINVATLLLFGWDKLMARRERRRVREATLLWCTFACGCVGAWCAMQLFRHKTRKSSFRRWAIAATVLNPAWLVVWWAWRAGA